MVDLTQMSPKEIVEALPSLIKPEMVKGMDFVIQFKLTGEGGGEWHLIVKDDAATVEQGVAEKPRLTLTAAANDFKNVLSGKANATQAFMMGKLKVTGDMSLAMKLINMFKI
jgi:putative sterol carrier protein